MPFNPKVPFVRVRVRVRVRVPGSFFNFLPGPGRLRIGGLSIGQIQYVRARARALPYTTVVPVTVHSTHFYPHYGSTITIYRIKGVKCCTALQLRL
jgi:hypothetical protein